MHKDYVIWAYVIGLGLFVSYALILWLESRKLAKREQLREGQK